jgi:hypothetical protein
MIREDASTFALVRELFVNLRTLIQQEAALARAEFRDELRRLLFLLMLLGAALAVLSVSALWLLVALTRELAATIGLPLSSAYAAVGLTLGVAGAVLSLLVWHHAGTIRVLPQTRETVAEGVHWPDGAATPPPRP